MGSYEDKVDRIIGILKQDLNVAIDDDAHRLVVAVDALPGRVLAKDADEGSVVDVTRLSAGDPEAKAAEKEAKAAAKEEEQAA